MIVRRSILRHSRRSLWKPICQPPPRNIASEVAKRQPALTEQEQGNASIDLAELSLNNRSVSLSSQEQVSTVDPLVEAFQTSKHIENTTGQLGSDVSPAYQPNQLVTDPPRPSDVTLELLLASQAHLGHSTSLWHPANSRYIFGIRQGIHIISLEATASHLRRAAKIVAGVAERGGIVLFVGTRPGQERCVVKAAELTGGCYLSGRWTPGAVTNGEQILGKCARKLVNEFDEDVPGYEEQIVDRPVLKPDLVVCLNTIDNEVMLHECALANIPTIGVIDTDTNPTWVTYPIPANDDSLRSMYVVAGVLGRAGEEGRLRRLEAARRGHIHYKPATGFIRIQNQDERDGLSDSADVKDGQKSNSNANGYLEELDNDASNPRSGSQEDSEGGRRRRGRDGAHQQDRNNSFRRSRRS